MSSAAGPAPTHVVVDNLPLSVNAGIPVPVPVKLPTQYELKVVEIAPVPGQQFDITITNTLKPLTDSGFSLVGVLPTAFTTQAPPGGGGIFILQKPK
jgi:hypothetical protein